MKEEMFWILLSKKLAGEASEEELSLLNSLLANRADWAITSDHLHELWESTPNKKEGNQLAQDAYLSHIGRLKDIYPDFDAADEPFSTETVDTIPSLDEPTFFRQLLRKPATKLLMSFVVLGLIFLGFQFFNQGSKTQLVSGKANDTNEVTINPGSKSKITLPDGSKVWINSGSTLNYALNFGGPLREVYLNGEAFFEVAKDANKPFIVHTSGIDIRVLGTSFNVKAFELEPTIETTLIHGSIEVLKKDDPTGASVLLKPHEKLVFKKINHSYQNAVQHKRDKDQLKPVTLKSLISINPLRPNVPDSALVETAWLYNKLAFEDESLSELAKKMERWYNIKINIVDESLFDYRVSGSFVDETAEQALNELKLLIPFKFNIKNNEYIIMK